MSFVAIVYGARHTTDIKRSHWLTMSQWLRWANNGSSWLSWLYVALWKIPLVSKKGKLKWFRVMLQGSQSFLPQVVENYSCASTRITFVCKQLSLKETIYKVICLCMLWVIYVKPRKLDINIPKEEETKGIYHITESSPYRIGKI